MPKKRTNGEGGVYKVSKPGQPTQWVAVLDLGMKPARDKKSGRLVTNADGGQKFVRDRRHFYGATKAEVVARLEKAKREVADVGSLSDEGMTVEQYVQQWLANVLPGTVKESTAEGYGVTLRLYATPYIGQRKITRLSPADLQTWMQTLTTAGFAPRTRKQVRAILHRAFADAVRLKILRVNPLDGVRGPSVPRTQTDDALTTEEARKLLAVMRECVVPEQRSKYDAMAPGRWCEVPGCRNGAHALEAGFRLALSVGLRKGELLALRWTDVDLDAGTLTVARTLKYMSGRGLVFDTPKTEAARRTIPLPPSAVAMLRQHRAKQNAERLAASTWAEQGLIFTTATGGPIDPANALRRYQALTVRAGLGKRRIHGARHTAASLMLDQGVPLEVVGKMLGHASYSITADVYGHLTPQALRKASDAMEAALGG